EFRGRESSRNGSGLQANSFGGGKFTMRLGRLFEKAAEIGFCRLRLAALRHGQKVAQQSVKSTDLLQDRLQRGCSTVFVTRGNGVFSFQPHGRDGIADFMRDARRQSADGGKPLGGAGAAALLADTLAGGVERVHQPVELALPRERQGREIVSAGRKRCFQPRELL